MSAPTLLILAAGLGTRFGGVKQLAPVGPNGEAILDLSARDARAAGFGPVVLVVRSDIEAAVAAHVEAHWPAGAQVSLVCQDREPHAVQAAAGGRRKPLGTAHALLAAAPLLSAPFAVINADDLYGPGPYVALREFFAAGGTDALVAFEVANTLLGDQPVTRALCEVDGAGHLLGIEEGTVQKADGTREWIGRSGRRLVLTGREPVSMNFWGFGADVLASVEAAVERFFATGRAAADDEVLLPDVVRELLGRADRTPFTVLRTAGHCLGVTHRDDLARMRAAVAGTTW